MTESLLLHEAAAGFTSAGEDFCRLSPEVQNKICFRVLRFISGRDATLELSGEHIREVTGREVTGKDSQSFNSVVNAVTYIFRYAVRQSIDPDNLKAALSKSSSWNDPAALDVIHRVYTQHLQQPTPSESLATRFAGVGQLIDMQWKVGLSMSSSSCRQLNAPFVTVLFKVADPAGEVITKSVEMSLTEFREFSQQMHDLSFSLSSV